MSTSRLMCCIVNEEQTTRIEICDRHGASLGYLAPITRSSLEDAELIGRLTHWRNLTARFFFSQRHVTRQQTRDWLENAVLNDGGRLLFVIFSNRNPVGTVGLKLLTEREAEIGNLVRGEPGGDFHLMDHAEWALIDWTFSNFDVEVICGMALASNLMCLNLQKALGFRMTRVIPLHKVESDGGVVLRPGEPGSESPEGLYAHKMELTRSEFMCLRDPNSRRPDLSESRRGLG